MQQSTSLCDTKYKIVFLGNMGVGKTSIIERFVKDEFQPFNNPTVGIDFLTRNISFQSEALLIYRYTITHSQDKVYRLQLWDTAGQQKYKSLVPAYLRDADCAVFVFDYTKKQSFWDLKSWVQLYRDHAKSMSIGFILGTLLLYFGNKCDLLDSSISKESNSPNSPRRCPDFEEEAEQFANNEGMRFGFVSAKTGINVTLSFQNMILELNQIKKKTFNPINEDPEAKLENEVLSKISKLSRQNLNQKKITNCCYI